MNIRIDLNKRDLLSIAVLCIIFFSVAIWNLGLTQVPLTNWQANENKTFYIDLGKPESVGTVYFLVKNGSANVQVYTGSPGNWSDSRSFVIPTSYYSWSEVNINSGTQYVRFNFEQASIEVAEIAVLSQDNQRIAITAINSEGASDPNLSHLIDEQNLVQLPPTYLGNDFRRDLLCTNRRELPETAAPVRVDSSASRKTNNSRWNLGFRLQPVWMANNGRHLRYVNDTIDLHSGKEVVRHVDRRLRLSFPVNLRFHAFHHGANGNC